MTTTYDAIVVGARCAGAGTALLLARQGRRVLVLDRIPAPTDTLSTHAMLRAGVLQLHRWGVLDRVVAAGTPPVRRTTFHLADGDIPISIKPAGGVDAFFAPRRSVLDGILVEAAREAGAEVRFGARVLDVVRRGGRVVGVHGVGHDGRPFTVRGRIVIGADGRTSTIAAAVGAPTLRVARASSGFVYGYVPGVQPDGFRWWFRHGGSAGLIPTNHGESCVFAGAGGGLPEGPAAEVLARLLVRTAPELVDELAGAGPLRGLRAFPGAPGYLRRPWGPGWALVGDAGYLKDPITAHGMSDALRDAELLARAVIAAGDGSVSEAEALAGYHTLRDRLSVPLFDVAEQLAAHEWGAEEVRELLLLLSSAMTDEVEHLLQLDDPSQTRTAAVA